VRLKRTTIVVVGLTSIGLVAPASAASAGTKTPPNIIKDGGAEGAKQADLSGVTRVPVASWTPFPARGFTVVRYGSPEFLTKTGPGPKVRGKNFFAGGEYGPSPAGATQVDSLKPYLALIAKGKAKFTLSGWFGGFTGQRDYSTLSVVWKNAKGVVVGKPKPIGGVTDGQRKGITALVARSAKGTVPKSATQVLVTIKMVRLDGGYDDGYADNLSLVITK
jgi:hypothetical protein